jgi:hypothetical protein
LDFQLLCCTGPFLSFSLWMPVCASISTANLCVYVSQSVCLCFLTFDPFPFLELHKKKRICLLNVRITRVYVRWQYVLSNQLCYQVFSPLLREYKLSESQKQPLNKFWSLFSILILLWKEVR